MKDAKLLESIPVSDRRKVNLHEYGEVISKTNPSYKLSETALKCSRTSGFFELCDSETNENFIICEARYRFGTVNKCQHCGVGFSISSAKALAEKKLVDEVPLVQGNMLTFYKELTCLRREPLELAVVIPLRKLRKAGVSLSPGQLVEVKIRPMRIVE